MFFSFWTRETVALNRLLFYKLQGLFYIRENFFVANNCPRPIIELFLEILVVLKNPNTLVSNSTIDVISWLSHLAFSINNETCIVTISAVARKLEEYTREKATCYTIFESRANLGSIAVSYNWNTSWILLFIVRTSSLGQRVWKWVALGAYHFSLEGGTRTNSSFSYSCCFTSLISE